MLSKKSGAILAVCAMLVSCNQKKSSDARITVPSASRTQESQGLDRSPMDMSYFPVDYPILKMSGKIKSPPVARVIYSRPKKEGRTIFGDLVKYGSRWRLGANEATEIEFFSNVTLQGKLVKKGRYVIYCIPFKDRWTVILNQDLFTWGLKIDSSKDVLSVDTPVKDAGTVREVFTMEFRPAAKGAELVMAWDRVEATLQIDIP